MHALVGTRPSFKCRSTACNLERLHYEWGFQRVDKGHFASLVFACTGGIGPSESVSSKRHVAKEAGRAPQPGGWLAPLLALLCFKLYCDYHSVSLSRSSQIAHESSSSNPLKLWQQAALSILNYQQFTDNLSPCRCP